MGSSTTGAATAFPWCSTPPTRPGTRALPHTRWSSDLSRHGARLSVDWACEPGERLRLVLLLDDGPVEVAGSIAIAARATSGEGWSVGVDFDELDRAAMDALVSWCFHHPFGAPAVPDPSVAIPAPDQADREVEILPMEPALAVAEIAAAAELADDAVSGAEEDGSPPSEA